MTTKSDCPFCVAAAPVSNEGLCAVGESCYAIGVLQDADTELELLTRGLHHLDAMRAEEGASLLFQRKWDKGQARLAKRAEIRDLLDGEHDAIAIALAAFRFW